MSRKDTDNAAALAALLKKIASKAAPEPDQRDPVEQLIFSFLLYDSVSRKAELALGRLLELGVDLNELRTFELEHIASTIGRTYPKVEERAARIKSTLGEVFLREHQVSLDGPKNLAKRDSRKYLDTLEGMHPFVSARVFLLSFKGHAVPLDERTQRLLVDEGVLTEDQSLPDAISAMERMIRAADSVPAHMLLQQWSESKAGGSRSSSGPRRTKAASARVGARR